MVASSKDNSAAGRDASLPPDYAERWIAQTQILLDCHERLVGTPLLHRSGDKREEALRLFRAPFAVLSHGTEPDPVLNLSLIHI